MKSRILISAAIAALALTGISATSAMAEPATVTDDTCGFNTHTGEPSNYMNCSDKNLWIRAENVGSGGVTVCVGAHRGYTFLSEDDPSYNPLWRAHETGEWCYSSDHGHKI
ncbi:hypothetical protein D5S17_27800 [Pseudonocardiaceae bacterium YIM PH 21723]|nr:hypothetical protein D5S17_27800 [Pseudonocardiaceae bacterium YIM PH 21723]